jgi:CoA-transferase family III
MSENTDDRDATAARLLDEAWMELTTGDDVVRPPVDVTGSWGHLPSQLAAEEIAQACVAVALAAAGAQPTTRGAARPVRLDRGHIGVAVRSERYFGARGQSARLGFAPLSRFWKASDGWVRTHANYPWHRRALLDALELAHDAEADLVADAIAERRAEDVEAEVFARGGVAGATRTAASWAADAQGRAVDDVPLIGHRRSGDAPPRLRPRAQTSDALPASGVRVLDLTRVIAGPVSTRYLAALGADVLRIDPPAYPDMAAGAPGDTLLGKRSALVDLADRRNDPLLEELLRRADVVVRGYRPGALDRFGLDEDQLAERFPGLVVVSLAAWGHEGPWAGRRGFDSVVQSVTGVAALESREGLPAGEPGVLPCQLLDHGTGYLAAAAALDGLRRQRAAGGTHLRRVSLARTAAWLTAQGSRGSADGETPSDVDEWLVELQSSAGPVAAVAPPGQLGDRPLAWPEPMLTYGESAPTFAG